MVLALCAFGALIAALTGVALSWDGSAYLFNALDSQQPFTPHDRLVNVITQAPTLLAQTFTDRLGVLRLVFGISYLAIPVLALLACFLVVRRRREEMFVWPVIAICAATVPGQINPSSEALQASQMVWPLLLAAIVGLDRRDGVAWLAVLTTGLFAALAHPVGVPLLGGVLLVGILYRRRSVSALAALLLVTALVNAWLTADPYQGDRITINVVTYSFDRAIAGAPLVAIASSAAGAALLAVADRTRHRNLLGAGGVACLALAIAALVGWASDPRAWDGAIEFRTLAAVAILPVALIAVLDGWREPAACSPWRQLAAVTASAGFALIMAVQGLSVQRLDALLANDIRTANSACVPQENIPGVNGTMLDSWATPYRSLVLGGRTAREVVLWGDECRLLTMDGAVPIDYWQQGTLDASGWFDLRGLAGKP
jgi:hypothetical protein